MFNSNSWSNLALLVFECKEKILRNEKADGSRVKEFGGGGGSGGEFCSEKNPQRLLLLTVQIIFAINY